MDSIDVRKVHVETTQLMIQVLVEEEKEKRNDQNKIPPSIYIVDNTLRDLKPTSYNPRVVAIGPLHKNREELKDFETYKVTYLVDLFRRLSPASDQRMDECVESVYAKVPQIRERYAREMEEYDDCEVAKMMVIDACFILEFIFRVNNNLIPEDDPIFNNKLVSANVMHDLILLENQIPFFVLQDIFKCTILELFDPPSSLQTQVLLFLDPIIPFVIDDMSNVTNIINDGIIGTNYEHILGLLQKFCQPADAKQSGTYEVSRFHTVTELSMAGVNFKRNRDKKWPLAMEFKASWFPCFVWSWGKPTLRMPVLLIEDHTESVLRNLIAYEQCSPVSATYITSYVVAIDMLVDTTEDIIQMVDSEVLVNRLGTNKVAANMISDICENIVVADFYYCEQWKQLYDYYNGYWPKNIAWLRRTYFSSPWNFIALVAGIILFGLTVVQTYYSIK